MNAFRYRWFQFRLDTFFPSHPASLTKMDGAVLVQQAGLPMDNLKSHLHTIGVSYAYTESSISTLPRMIMKTDCSHTYYFF